MVDLQPLPQNFPIVDKDGFYTVAFKRFMDNVLKRMLGVRGGVYITMDASASGVVWDLDANTNIVITLSTAVTVVTTLNQVAGAPPNRITVIQDGVGGRLITWGSEFKFPSAVAPVLSVGANAVDELCFDSDGTNMRQQYFNKDLR